MFRITRKQNQENVNAQYQVISFAVFFFSTRYNRYTWTYPRSHEQELDQDGQMWHTGAG